jgi:hypothetical protein
MATIGCGDGSITTAADAKVWFARNDRGFIQIRDLLRDHPNIRSVGGSIDAPRYREFAPLSAADGAAYDVIKRLMPDLKIRRVRVNRGRDQLSGDIISVSMNLYSQGIVGRARAINISYIVSRELIDNLPDPGSDTRLHALLVPDWYVKEFGFGPSAGKSVPVP